MTPKIKYTTAQLFPFDFAIKGSQEFDQFLKSLVQGGTSSKYIDASDPEQIYYVNRSSSPTIAVTSTKKLPQHRRLYTFEEIQEIITHIIESGIQPLTKSDYKYKKIFVGKDPKLRQKVYLALRNAGIKYAWDANREPNSSGIGFYIDNDGDLRDITIYHYTTTTQEDARAYFEKESRQIPELELDYVLYGVVPDEIYKYEVVKTYPGLKYSVGDDITEENDPEMFNNTCPNYKEFFKAHIVPNEKSLSLSNGKTVRITPKGLQANENSQVVNIDDLRSLSKILIPTVRGLDYRIDISFSLGCWKNVLPKDLDLIIKTYDELLQIKAERDELLKQRILKLEGE